MINHIKVIGIYILSLLLCSIETHAVRGAGGDFTFNAANGKGDMNVGALTTDNFANSDSNDFSFSFNPDAMMGGNIGDVSIGGGQSEYAGSGNDYAGSTINAGGTVSGQANDMNIIDSQITGDKIDIDLAGNLTVETTPDTWQGSGSSWNANIGTGGFGGGQGAITEDKNWTETPAGIFGKSEVNIDVGDTTKLVGGAIVSETDGGLDLVTGDLVVEDVAINDYARDEYTGGQVNVNIGNVVTGEGDAFTENKYGTVEHSDSGHDKQGSVNSTLSGLGELTIGGEEQDLAKLDDLGINTDADNIVTITKDESWEESFKVDLINVGVAAEQVENLVNVVESFTAKVPDHVKAQGKAAEDIYRKAIANGMDKDNLKAFANSAEFAQVASLRARIEQEYENGTATAEYIYTQLHNEVLAFANDYVVQNCSSGTAICDSILRAMGTSSEDLSSGAIVAKVTIRSYK